MTAIFRLTACLVLLCLASPVGAQDAPAFESVKVPTPAEARGVEVRKQTRGLREKADRDGLEALAAELRASKETLDNTQSLLSLFYRGAVAIPKEEPAQTEAMTFYEKWAADHPESITAQVCLARAYTSFAWNARGSGWGKTVTQEGWKLFGDRLARAWDVLERAAALKEKCPGWFAAAQTVALGQGWDKADYLRMVDKAIQENPSCGEFYTNASYWLLPRWYGKEGEFEKWLAQQADTYPEDQRDRQYARFVWLADAMPVSGEIAFSPEHLDWERTQRGFDAWLKDSPDNLVVRSEYIRLAVLANDSATTREQLEVTGPKFFAGIWKPEIFEQVWKYAFDEGPNPLMEDTGSSSQNSSPVAQIPAETRAKIVSAIPVISGLIGGFLVGLLLFFLALQRRQIWAGVAAFFASLILAALFGTLAAALPALGLWFYLRQREHPFAHVVRTPSPWIVLAVVVGMIVFYFALQIGITIMGSSALLLKEPTINSEDLMKHLMSDNRMLFGLFNSAWITLLLLLLICRPQSTHSWLDRFGLHNPPIKAALLWTLAAIPIIIAAGYAVELIPDERTREMIKLMAGSGAAPVMLILAYVIGAPLYEELLYRGYAFSGWVDRIGPGWTILASSVIFAATHVQYGLAGLAYVFILGITLGVVRWKTGSVYPTLALHSGTNLLACFLPQP